MTPVLFVRRFLADYARNPVNLLMLVVVPTVFVIAVAGSLAEVAGLLGGPRGPAVETATAGWAAGFLAALAMYFQIAAARAADRRLVLAGLPTRRLVSARLATGLVLALLTAAVSVAALATGTGIDAPARVLAGTLMFAVVYVAIGALVGGYVRSPVNGTVLILFIWILDVFLGPAMGSADRVATRWLPTHFVSLWTVDLPSRHGGRPGDLGWALVWTVGAVLVAWAAVVRSSRTARPRAGNRPGTLRARLASALRMGLRDYRRNPVLWVLLIVVPVVFVLLARAVTPDEQTTLPLIDGGRALLATFALPDIHAGTMAPIAVGSLAALAGVFIGLDTRPGDQRLVLAGFPTGVLLTARLFVVAAAALLVTAASLAVTATVFDARQWGVFAAATFLLGLTYGLLGIAIGQAFGRVAGVFIAFLTPFLDLGIGQSPMLRPEPPDWAEFMPGYGASRVLLDAGLSDTFDRPGSLLVALAWLAGLGLLATLLWRRPVGPEPRPGAVTSP
jgi:ABC-2 family transporter protein